MSKKKLLLIIGAVVVVAALVVANLTMNTTNATEVQSDRVLAKDITETVSASGRIQPQTKVDIKSEVNGEIIALGVREGDRVDAGTLLVVLDTVQLSSDVDQARFAVAEINARLDGAKSMLDEAQEEYDRETRLMERDHSSEVKLKAAKYRYQNSKASYEAMQAQAKQSQARLAQQLDYLAKAKIVAPMTGIVTLLDCEVGEIAAAQSMYSQGRTLMTIANLDVFEVEVEVDETEINKVNVGQAVKIEVDAFPDTVFAGNVVEVGNTAISSVGQEQGTNFRVKVIFEDPRVKLRPGMSATVDITSDERLDVLTVPYSAVVMRSFDVDSLADARRGENAAESSSVVGEVHAAEADDSTKIIGEDESEREELKGVFVIRDGVARFVEIETGIADQKRIEITSGLNAEDTVISGPYRVLRTIKDGDEVKPELKNGDKD
ncbi:MAG: efflux RND transporter periplasmic adaptor subunit [bacterium]